MKYIKRFENQQSTLSDNARASRVAEAMQPVWQPIIGFKNLLKDGADPNELNLIQRTPMCMAISGAGTQTQINKIIDLLVKYGADINLGKTTPLMRAAQLGMHSVIDHLIDLGADWNIKDSDNKTFLRYLDSTWRAHLVQKYPDKYEDYLFHNDVDKYNI